MEEVFGEELTGDICVERSVEVASDPDAIWEHLTDGGLISEWMGDPVTFDPQVGGRIEMAPPDGEIVWGTVEEIVPGRRIQWSWRTDAGMPTLVEIEVEPTNEGWRITVRESLLPWQVVRPDLRDLPPGDFGPRRASLSLAA